MHASWLIVAASLAISGPNAGDDNGPGKLIAEGSRVELIHDVIVAAEEAGVLTELDVKEGQHVEAGALLGRIKDTRAQAARKLALAEAEVAKKEAENDVDVRYAEKQRDVAWVIHDKNAEANKLNKNKPNAKVIPETELLKLKLEAERADLQHEQALFKGEVSKLQHDAKLAAVAAADDDIERRKVIAPLAGEVRQVFQKRGQWVNPGDQIAHIVDLSTLRVVAKVEQRIWSPAEIDGQQVVATAMLKSGEVLFKGKVVFVDPQVSTDTYEVHIEVENRREKKHWLLLPGTSVSVSLDAAAPEPEETAARR